MPQGKVFWFYSTLDASGSGKPDPTRDEDVSEVHISELSDTTIDPMVPGALDGVAAMFESQPTIDEDEANADIESESTSVEEAPEEDAEDDDELEEDIFSNQSEMLGTKKGYTLTVTIGKTKFFGVEATKEVEAAYRKQIKAVENESKVIGKLQEQLQAQAKANKLDEAAIEKRSAEIESRSEANAGRIIKANEYLINRTVRDWSNPTWPRKPRCTEANRAKISPSRKAQLADLIMQKTKTGRANSDFLVPS
jgi:regulator of protease activity HflC (stomatin/prohibitin superfamily)